MFRHNVSLASKELYKQKPLINLLAYKKQGIVL